MQLKRYFVLILSTCAFLLGACNLSASNPTPTISIEAIVATQLASMPTNTMTPVPLNTATPTSPPPTIPVTPTLTLFYDATVTSTPSLADCPIIVTNTDTKAGDMLHITRCEDNFEYDLGPFAKGVYAVGPNHKFIVYVTNSGYVYAAAIGKQDLVLVSNLVRERKFAAVNTGVRPYFVISFSGEEPHYKLILTDKRFGQKFVYELPVNILE